MELGWGGMGGVLGSILVFYFFELWFCSFFLKTVLLYSKPYFERMQGVWFLSFTEVFQTGRAGAGFGVMGLSGVSPPLHWICWAQCLGCVLRLQSWWRAALARFDGVRSRGVRTRGGDSGPRWIWYGGAGWGWVSYAMLTARWTGVAGGDCGVHGDLGLCFEEGPKARTWRYGRGGRMYV